MVCMRRGWGSEWEKEEGWVQGGCRNRGEKWSRKYGGIWRGNWDEEGRRER